MALILAQLCFCFLLTCTQRPPVSASGGRCGNEGGRPAAGFAGGAEPAATPRCEVAEGAFDRYNWFGAEDFMNPAITDADRDRWPELPLEAWQDTYQTLHMWSQIVGKGPARAKSEVNHWWDGSTSM